MPEQPTSQPKSKFSRGEGVPRKVVVEEKPAVAEPEPTSETDDQGRTKWSDKPSLADQYKRYPKTCKEGPIQFKTFDLSQATQLAELNKDMEGAIPPDAPHIITKLQREFYAGAYHVIMEYRVIKYMKLLERK